MGIKIAVIGGASSYTPELFDNLVDFKAGFEVDEVILMDLNTEKLKFIAGVCERLIGKSGLGVKLSTTDLVEKAVAGVDFIILQIRVGGLNARVRDENIPMDLDMIGNETTGAGGFSCALRTVPVALDIARRVEAISPLAWVLNLSNPAGIVTEALLKHTQVRTLGFCNIPINTTYAFAGVLDEHPERVRLDSFGLNHLSWSRAVYVDGEERLKPLLESAHDRESILYKSGLVESLIDPQWLQTLGMIPSWYARYFYYPDEILESDRQKPQTRGQEDKQSEKLLAELYNTVGYGRQAKDILKAKGGAQYYWPVMQVIESIVQDRGDIITVDTRNGQTLTDLPPQVCVEVPAKIYQDRVEPLTIGAMPLTVRGLVQVVKTYEELTVEAAISGDHNVALAALMANPLVSSFSKAKQYLDQVLENDRDYIPAFYGSA
jgi:6-phospho-beta-glucosidase